MNVVLSYHAGRIFFMSLSASTSSSFWSAVISRLFSAYAPPTIVPTGMQPHGSSLLELILDTADFWTKNYTSAKVDRYLPEGYSYPVGAGVLNFNMSQDRKSVV